MDGATRNAYMTRGGDALDQAMLMIESGAVHPSSRHDEIRGGYTLDHAVMSRGAGQSYVAL
jgi:hypothetical protein